MVPLDELEDDHKRSRFRRAVAPAVVLLAVAGIAFGLLRPAGDDESAGRRAPSFELPYLGRDGTLTSDELEGKPVVLNLWASWCGPCRDEAPALEATWKKYKDRVTIVGINVRDKKESALEFARDFGITYPLVRDEDRSVEKALGAFGLPQTFFIDHTWHFLGVGHGDRAGSSSRGSVRGNVYLGGISAEELEANIEALLQRAEEDA